MNAKYRFATVAACVLVAACGTDGGGGVNSTPAPPTGGTPTPPPPPPPPPPSNSSLANLQFSESFKNDATLLAAGPGSATAGAATLTVSYDATTNSYTVTEGSRTQTFRPQDIDSSQTTTAANVYVRKTGTVTDMLTMSRPGTSGAGVYTYVASGLFQRSDATGATADAFTFGVVTPDSAVPRTGGAVYEGDLKALVQGTVGQTYNISGGSRFDVNFGSGNIVWSGGGSSPASGGTPAANFDLTGSGTLSSSANLFAGTAKLVGAGMTLTGALNGRLYGPNAEEIGAAFAVSGAGAAGVGTLIARNNALGKTQTLTNLTLPVNVFTQGDKISYEQNTATSATRPGEIVREQVSSDSAIALTADPVKKSYTFPNPFTIGINPFQIVSNVFFQASDRDAASSNGHIDVFRKTVTANGATTTETLKIYKPGSSNDELVLNYASFGNVVLEYLADHTTTIIADRRWFTWGLATDPSSIPRAGTANYAGVIYGDAVAGSNILALTGTASFNFDMGAGSFKASLVPVATDSKTGTAYQLGTFGFTGNVPVFQNIFAATSFTVPTSGQATLAGRFYGPNAQELGAGFRLIAIPNPAGPGTMDAVGVAVAKQR